MLFGANSIPSIYAPASDADAALADALSPLLQTGFQHAIGLPPLQPETATAAPSSPEPYPPFYDEDHGSDAEASHPGVPLDDLPFVSPQRAYVARAYPPSPSRAYPLSPSRATQRTDAEDPQRGSTIKIGGTLTASKGARIGGNHDSTKYNGPMDPAIMAVLERINASDRACSIEIGDSVTVAESACIGGSNRQFEVNGARGSVVCGVVVPSGCDVSLFEQIKDTALRQRMIAQFVAGWSGQRA